MKWLACLAALLTASCSKVFLQDDGFATRIQAGCSDEASCRRLALAAEQRTLTCKDNTVGYVRCADARADKLAADALVAPYDEERQRRKEADRAAEAAARAAEARAASERAEAERQRRAIAPELDREKRILAVCDASRDARAARRRRHALLENGEAVAAVRKQCAPRREVQVVSGECKDENGFKRPCAKNVAGDVVGYICPKTMDPELEQLGLFQLGFGAYPYPEERQLRVDDVECERATLRLKELTQRLSEVSQ